MAHGNWPRIDHSLLSPSGRMSKRARAAAMERERVKLFGEQGLQSRAIQNKPSSADRIIQLTAEAKRCRDFVANGYRTRAFTKQAEECAAEIARLTAEIDAA